MGTKLHPPYPNQDCLPVFWSEKCLQCLKNMGLYNSFGIGRFSLWPSWLTRASRLANSQASASNAGVPDDPNSPESNCLYLALIWSVKELYSLCASCTVNKETGFGMTETPKVTSRVLLVKIKGLSFGQLSGKWLEILRESSCQKLVCEKSNFCKIQGMSEGSKLIAACCMLARLYEISYVERVERNKNSHNTVDLRHVEGVKSPFDLQCRF